jgi:hypothetical protein
MQEKETWFEITWWEGDTKIYIGSHGVDGMKWLRITPMAVFYEQNEWTYGSVNILRVEHN